MPDYLLSFLQDRGSPRVVVCRYSAVDAENARRKAEKLLSEKGASTGVVYSRMVTHGQIEIRRIGEVASVHLTVSDSDI